MDSPAPAQHAYKLGHSATEVRRLELQARYIGGFTEDILKRARLVSGMRVLDLGCGIGDVSFLAASLVGPMGDVRGIDAAPGAIDIARQRAASAGMTSVHFDVAGVMDFDFSNVDAIIGRLILLHIPDPVQLLARVASTASPGTLVVFHELDMSTARSVPESPLCTKGLRLLIETFRRAGIDPDIGSKLFTLFRQAGLPDPDMLLAARIEGGPDAFAYQYLADTLRTLMPLAQHLGIADADSIDIDTLTTRLRDEIVSLDGVMQPPAYLGAWARVAHSRR
ncbi:hypothetical protein BVER_01518c [Candidatus Burkholderia verschuerenii]|uniref:Methyltransferase domain-containing protein n=1 Tax=Candidatus Burkholderia verschuerenii TaxID=242163 RepID=A0A0L0MHZ3_9BURK|nr:class I SAM-dependent methyltransferase [Candidatus Burkholderia verschuerenii]KND61920.1 hypothetical protein BVER_01518c [Candidatus Burkholderia verschuerenii]